MGYPKTLASLSSNEIELIRDEAIKKIVIEALHAAGIEYGRGKKFDKKKYQTAVTG